MGRALVSLVNRVPPPLAAPFRPGARLSRVVAPLVERGLPRSETVVVVRRGPARGLRIAVDPRCEKFYWTGGHEPAVQRALVRLLRPGACFWDVGAHAGFFSLLASRLVGPSGTVLAFEPVPSNRARLERSLRANGAANVEVHEVALGADPGTASLRSSGSSLTWRMAPGGAVSAPRGTLDDAVAGRRAPDVVKVDAEGAELDVLRGGARLLEGRRPALVVELHGRAVAEALAVVPGYGAERLDDSHWLLEARTR